MILARRVESCFAYTEEAAAPVRLRYYQMSQLLCTAAAIRNGLEPVAFFECRVSVKQPSGSCPRA